MKQIEVSQITKITALMHCQRYELAVEDWCMICLGKTCGIRQLTMEEGLILIEKLARNIVEENRRDTILLLAKKIGITTGYTPFMATPRKQFNQFIKKMNWSQSCLERCSETELDIIETNLWKLDWYKKEYRVPTRFMRRQAKEALEVMFGKHQTDLLLQEMMLQVMPVESAK